MNYYYYGYTPSLYTTNWYPEKTSPTIYNHPYRIEPRQIALSTDMSQVITQEFNDGFTRHIWPNIEIVKPREYVDFRLITPSNKNVISAGFGTNPVTNIFPIQITPLIDQKNVMVVMLHNQSPDQTLVDLWVVTK
ncbi:hypothetical protein [Bacillus mycoides]|uniref:hypothetical protein n=1 Tax=Bacillus mycoides TaxID=1405 RepID=UPI003808192B